MRFLLLGGFLSQLEGTERACCEAFSGGEDDGYVARRPGDIGGMDGTGAKEHIGGGEWGTA